MATGEKKKLLRAWKKLNNSDSRRLERRRKERGFRSNYCSTCIRTLRICVIVMAAAHQSVVLLLSVVAVVWEDCRAVPLERGEWVSSKTKDRFTFWERVGKGKLWEWEILYGIIHKTNYIQTDSLTVTPSGTAKKCHYKWMAYTVSLLATEFYYKIDQFGNQKSVTVTKWLYTVSL